MLEAFISLADYNMTDEDACLQHLEPLIQNYYRVLFQALLQREATFSPQSNQPCVNISPFTFWQFSQLPKYVSDSLFASLPAQIPGSFSHFLEIFKILAVAEEPEQSKLIFGIIDRDGDNQISEDDCRAILNHSIGNPGGLTMEQVRQTHDDIKLILSQIFNDRNGKLSFSEFQKLRQDGTNLLQQKLLEYLQSHFKIKEKVKNYQITNPELAQFSLPFQLDVSLSSLKQTREDDRRRLLIKEEEHLSTTEEEEEGVELEGTLLKMINRSQLKPHYCRLVNCQLYIFSSKRDDTVREVIVLGREDTVHVEQSKYVTESDSNLFTVTIEQPHSKSVLYFLKKGTAILWRNSIARLLKKELLFSSKYKFGEIVGQGKFGVVRVAHPKEGKDRAVKIISKKELCFKRRKMLRQEIEIQATCNHPNLQGLEEVFEDRNQVYIVQQLMRKTSLQDLYDLDKNGLNYLSVLGIVKQIAYGLNYLKEFRIVHRDIKPKNILLTGRMFKVFDKAENRHYSYPEIKIADFGLSLILSGKQTCQEASGTLGYAAPEMLEAKPYNEMSDVYSLGVLMYKLLSGKLPFYHMDYNSLYKQVISQSRIILSQEAPFPSSIFADIPSDVKHLVQGKTSMTIDMMKKDPAQRISIEDVLKKIKKINEADSGSKA